MTSRRKFLGLLAAAPVVGPEMVKAAAAEAEGRLVVGRAFLGTSIKPRLYGSIKNFKPVMIDHQFQLYGDIVAGYPLMPTAQPNGVPNRLYGSYINEDGDAT